MAGITAAGLQRLYERRVIGQVELHVGVLMNGTRFPLALGLAQGAAAAEAGIAVSGA